MNWGNGEGLCARASPQHDIPSACMGRVCTHQPAWMMLAGRMAGRMEATRLRVVVVARGQQEGLRLLCQPRPVVGHQVTRHAAYTI